jgi:15-cis-phytoene desaturase
MSNTVAVLGGGVAGLSAAHELVERGFHVTVYEKGKICGGKARSLSVPNTALDPSKNLPGEHGFRFFPGFYRHLPDTMSRIPYGSGTVADNLVTADRIWVARGGQAPVDLPAKLPQKPEDWAVTLHVLFEGIGVPASEVAFFLDRLLVLATSCPERRDTEYEKLTWWDFIDAANRSHQYQTLLAEGLTRSLVAMRAEVGSTRTVGYILLQLLYGILSPIGFDRVLSGPSNDVWLTPWVTYLEANGVKFVNDIAVRSIQTDPIRVTAVVTEQGEIITADYYIAALPVETMQRLARDPLLKQHVPTLAGLDNLSTSWMNGIQFYLRKDVPLNRGHTLYADSPWALTSISQNQFWTTTPLSGYGDGKTGGILSVDISDWDTPGIRFGKSARECTAMELKTEVWAQLQAHLNVDGANPLQDGNVALWFLDPDIEFPNPNTEVNAEPLLINRAGTLQYRPETTTALSNFFLASDYVRTFTDLACMESANEAARRAVNGILASMGSIAAPASVWPLREPDFLQPLIDFDKLRFRCGLPHSSLLRSEGPILTPR